jgi:hypothetical protein
MGHVHKIKTAPIYMGRIQNMEITSTGPTATAGPPRGTRWGENFRPWLLGPGLLDRAAGQLVSHVPCCVWVWVAVGVIGTSYACHVLWPVDVHMMEYNRP